MLDVVVVAHGAPHDRLARCLDSLLASEGVEARIVLVDNAGPDPGPCREVAAARPAVTLVRCDVNRGFAAGVNAGLRTGPTSELCYVANDDTVVQRDALARLAGALQHAPRDVVAAAPKVLLGTDGTTDAVIDSVGIVLRPNGEAFNAGIGQPDLGQFADGTTVLGPCLAGAMVRRDAWTTVGPLDERYHLYYEDVDWALRATLSGRRTVAVTAAVVHHTHAASTRALGESKRYGLVQRNLLVCAAKNMSASTAWRVWIGRLVVHAKGTVTGPYRARRWQAVGSALVALPSVLAARPAVRHMAVLPDHAAWRFAAGEQPFFSPGGYRADRAGEARAAALRRLQAGDAP